MDKIIFGNSQSANSKKASIMDMTDEENIEWLMESSKTVENSGENDNCQVEEKESNELRNFLQVLQTAFESEPITLGTKVKGVVSSDEELQKLLKRLKALGYFFSIRSSDKKSTKRNCKLMVAKGMSNFSSHPYIIVSHVHYSCSHRNKELQRQKDPEKVASKKSRKYTDCKATMDIRQFEIFTNVCLAPIRRKRIEMLKKFRHSLASNTTEPGVLKYSVTISLPQAHNHPRDVRGQYLSDEVKAAMHSILQSGVTSVRDIQEKLYQIVDEDFVNDDVKPSRENSAFYPNQKTIYNHLRHDGLTLRKIYKKNNDIAQLKLKIFDELKCVCEDIKKCMDYEQLEKLHKLLKALRKRD